MYEYGLINIKTNQENIIFGYSLSDAFARNPSLDPNEWEVTYQEYVD